MRDQERAAASGSQLDPALGTQGKKRQLLDRHPAVSFSPPPIIMSISGEIYLTEIASGAQVETAVSTVCGATGLMRPELVRATTNTTFFSRFFARISLETKPLDLASVLVWQHQV